MTQAVATRSKIPFKRMKNGHLLVKIDEFQYRGALVIPEAAKRKPTKGEVIMVGEDIEDIATGDKVLYSQFAGYLLILGGTATYRIIGREEVLAVLNDDSNEEIEVGG